MNDGVAEQDVHFRAGIGRIVEAMDRDGRKWGWMLGEKMLMCEMCQRIIWMEHEEVKRILKGETIRGWSDDPVKGVRCPEHNATPQVLDVDESAMEE